ncbi:hypothetical protein ACJ73_09814 [Blastomyces percursus]|uniref:CCHC-type domain-containing protein n=1 Tax=Blastomyces percursus TaxID=1658174 RepID=A0A1J9P0Q1_9EURO|nr:hypothetical protein ACJ73_09814 [Blastomyces percursus]
MSNFNKESNTATILLTGPENFHHPETASWFDLYLLHEEEATKSDTVDFRKMAAKFRRRFSLHTGGRKSQKSIVKGSFISYAGSRETALGMPRRVTQRRNCSGDAPEGDVRDASPTARGDSRGRNTGSRGGRGSKRAWGERDSVSNPQVTCEACGYYGHLLKNCWVVFPEKRPEHSFISEPRARMVKRQIEEDEKLRTKIDHLQNKTKKSQGGGRKAGNMAGKEQQEQQSE